MFNMKSSVPYKASSLSRHAVFVRVGACLSLRVCVQSTCQEAAGHCAAGAGSGHRNAALQRCSRSGSNPTPPPGHGHTFSPAYSTPLALVSRSSLLILMLVSPRPLSAKGKSSVSDREAQTRIGFTEC